jgi:hypothetical protein
MEIRPTRPIAAPTARMASRGGTGAFRLSGEPGVSGARDAAPASAVGVDHLLALQEHEPDAERNGRARKHAQTMLDALRGLQLGLLGVALDEKALTRLDRLARTSPQAADPALAAAVAAIGQRAAVELARIEMSRITPTR